MSIVRFWWKLLGNIVGNWIFYIDGKLVYGLGKLGLRFRFGYWVSDSFGFVV